MRPVSYDETDGCVEDVPGLVCLEHAEECLGIRCPLFDVPTDGAMLRYEWFCRPPKRIGRSDVRVIMPD